MPEPVFTHGDWVQVYVERTGDRGPGFLRIVEKHGRPGVAVLVMRGTTVALVDVYRPAVGRVTAGVPRGFGETDDPVDDARREVREEVGIDLRRDDLVSLGPLHANDGLLAGEVVLFAAVTDRVGRPVDTDEVQQVRWIEVEDLLTMLAEGRVTDAFTHAVVLRAWRRGLLPGYTTSSK